MALAHDSAGFARGDERLQVPRWSEQPARKRSTTFARLTRSADVVKLPLDHPVTRQGRSKARAMMPSQSIYDMPVEPLPAPVVAWASFAGPGQVHGDAIVLPFVRQELVVSDHTPVDYRPAWIAAAFLAGSVCAAVTVTPTWFSVDPAAASSRPQVIASHLTSLVGVTGVAALAAVVSAVLLLIGTQHRPLR